MNKFLSEPKIGGMELRISIYRRRKKRQKTKQKHLPRKDTEFYENKNKQKHLPRKDTEFHGNKTLHSEPDASATDRQESSCICHGNKTKNKQKHLPRKDTEKHGKYSHIFQSRRRKRRLYSFLPDDYSSLKIPKLRILPPRR